MLLDHATEVDRGSHERDEQRLGFYRCLAKDGAVTAQELAERTGTHPRYAREWLEQQAASGLLEHAGDGPEIGDVPLQPVDYDVEIRKVICSTNAIESLNARYRRAVKARGHFPTEQAALKCLYLVTRALDPTGKGQARWAMRWKPALNAFAITFAGRIVPSNGS